VTSAAPGGDVAVLQTATSLAVLTSSTYDALRALPFGGGATAVPLVREHLDAGATALRAARDQLGAATRAAGGRAQGAPDPRFSSLVAAALPTVRVPGDVVGLALTLEDVLAQTLTRDAVDLSTPARRELAVGLAGAAAGRKAVLLICQSLLGTGQADLAVVPPDLSTLPAGIGAVGFPDGRFPVDKAAPAEEGVLR
jgi:hypothetical protein